MDDDEHPKKATCPEKIYPNILPENALSHHIDIVGQIRSILDLVQF